MSANNSGSPSAIAIAGVAVAVVVSWLAVGLLHGAEPQPVIMVPSVLLAIGLVVAAGVLLYRRLRPSPAYLVYLTVLIAGGCLAVLLYQSQVLFRFATTSPKLWNDVHTVDPILGWRTIPNHRGEYRFCGDRIPYFTDEYGFRVAESSGSGGSKGILLSLGCSWTEGAQVRAEETFTAVAADLLGVRPCNGGVSAYGLAQMLVLARRHVPTLQPVYLVAQHSPWLSWRSAQYFAPTRFGSRPTPYFSQEGDAGIQINPPVFLGREGMEAALIRAADGGSGAGRSLRFAATTGIPYCLGNYLGHLRFQAGRLLGTVAVPSVRLRELERFAYRELLDLCSASGTQLVIVSVGKKVPTKGELRPLTGLDGAIVVDAVSIMHGRLTTATREEIDKAYAHFHGNPPRVVDRHPNATAHRIIGTAIAEAVLAEEELHSQARKEGRTPGKG